MDFFKSQFDRIQAQISALTPTQKMLTGTLVAIMVMTLVWWSRYAGTAEMEPILDQSLTQEDIGRIEATLTQKNIDYKIGNDRILVATDRKIEALSILAYNGALPKDTASGFDEIIKQLSPWDGVGRQNAMFNHGKELTLSRVLSNFPDVGAAVVVIDPRMERHIGADIDSTASVMIQMKPGTKAGKQLVKGAASLVAGAQSGLAMKNIKVIVDGVAQKFSDGGPDGSMLDADSMLEARQNAEQMFAQKVVDHLADIPGVLVSVTVSVNNQSNVTDKTTVDEKKTLHVESKVITETTEQSTPVSTPLEAGAAANTQLAITGSAPAGGGESTSNTNKEQTDFTTVPALTTEHIQTPAGMVTPVAASVRIPHSHFVQVAKILGDGKDPDAQTLKQTIEDERQNTAIAVAKTLGLANTADVSVEVYADALPPANDVLPVSAASTVTLALGGHVKEIALGALALVSLFMVSSMVKKTGPALPAPVAAALAAPPRNVLGGPELVAGEAGDGGTLLNAVEMDEESVRNQQMMEQVATLVDENPDTAATLVKRWMNRG
jgi:flagellar biosynthesis/type III secretory pathway M-ring protein FliF/YscJ